MGAWFFSDHQNFRCLPHQWHELFYFHERLEKSWRGAEQKNAFRNRDQRSGGFHLLGGKSESGSLIEVLQARVLLTRACFANGWSLKWNG